MKNFPETGFEFGWTLKCAEGQFKNCLTIRQITLVHTKTCKRRHKQTLEHFSIDHNTIPNDILLDFPVQGQQGCYIEWVTTGTATDAAACRALHHGIKMATFKALREVHIATVIRFGNDVTGSHFSNLLEPLSKYFR